MSPWQTYFDYDIVIALNFSWNHLNIFFCWFDYIWARFGSLQPLGKNPCKDMVSSFCYSTVENALIALSLDR